MRRIMWLSIGFAVASAVGAYTTGGSWMIPCAVVVLIAALCLAFIGADHLPARIFAWILVGISLGCGWFALYRQVYLNPAVELDGQCAEVSFRTVDYSYETKYGGAFDAELHYSGNTYRVRVYLNEAVQLNPGDSVQGQFRFRVTTPEGKKEATYHRGRGILLIAYEEDSVSIVSGTASGLRARAAVLREHIRKILEETFPEDAYPFAAALLLGETRGLDYATDTALKISGIRHIVAVSGLHLSILYAFISTLTLRKRWLTLLAGIVPLTVFAAVCGFTPSVCRACIMVLLMMLSDLWHREYDGPTALGFAALVMLIANPLVITDIGFQLSVTSVAGIYLFSTRIRLWMQKYLGTGKGKGIGPRLHRWFTASVSVTLGAMSLSTPLCAVYFGAVSLVGILTNLLTLWVVALIFYGIIAIVFLYGVSGTFAAAAACAVSFPIRYVLTTAKVLASLPLAAVYTASPYISAWLVFVYILLAVYLVIPKSKPYELICCTVIGLCLALLCSWAEPLTDEFRLTVLDVGQGQCILLQSCGKTFLVDCGGDRDSDAADLAAETLLAQGITRLDGVILTHYDADHAGGVPLLLSRMDTDCLYLPDVAADSSIISQLAADTQILWIGQQTKISFGTGVITLYPPFYSGAENENSLCLLFETENCAILITGDRSAFGESVLLRQYSLPDVDLLIAGHHGSRNSTSDELLMTVRPETVIISVGENHYGHPSEELLRRLAEFGCTVFRTDQLGTVIYRR